MGSDDSHTEVQAIQAVRLLESFDETLALSPVPLCTAIISLCASISIYSCSTRNTHPDDSGRPASLITERNQTRQRRSDKMVSVRVTIKAGRGGSRIRRRTHVWRRGEARRGRGGTWDMEDEGDSTWSQRRSSWTEPGVLPTKKPKDKRSNRPFQGNRCIMRREQGRIR